MTGGRLSHADLVQALSDLRLPSLSTAALAADIYVAFALALIAALAVAGALRPLLARRARPVTLPPAPADKCEDLRRLDLVKRLAAVAPDEVAAFRAALYRPDAPFDEAELRRLLARHGRAPG